MNIYGVHFFKRADYCISLLDDDDDDDDFEMWSCYAVLEILLPQPLKLTTV